MDLLIRDQDLRSDQDPSDWIVCQDAMILSQRKNFVLSPNIIGSTRWSRQSLAVCLYSVKPRVEFTMMAPDPGCASMQAVSRQPVAEYSQEPIGSKMKKLRHGIGMKVMFIIFLFSRSILLHHPGSIQMHSEER